MEILRLEERLSREGVDEVFVHVNYIENGIRISYGHWLTAGEVVTYKADHTSITVMMESYRAEAIALKEASDAAALLPQPPLEG